MSKHTPGPWLRNKYGSLQASGGQKVAFRSIEILCAGDEESLAEAEANTDLAAAAPDLLDALLMAEKMLARLEPIVDLGEDDSISVESEIIFARAAIAKARGEQP